MSRLIDADKLRYRHTISTTDTTRPQSFPCITKEEIAKAPTVEAIPISKGAVNGDIIKRLFPHYDIEIDEHKGYLRIFYEDFYTIYPLRWWNAPYKGVEQ